MLLLLLLLFFRSVLFGAVISSQVLNQLSQRLQLLLIHKVELANKVVIVLETCVQVRLFAKTNNFVEVAVVDVGIDSE